jgi:hypothetical protein
MLRSVFSVANYYEFCVHMEGVTNGVQGGRSSTAYMAIIALKDSLRS